MARRLFLLAVVLAACRPEADQATSGTNKDSVRSVETLPDTTRPEPPTPFDAAHAVFDTTEPPQTVVEIPPTPRPLPRPAPRPAPPLPTPRAPAGSCDVRATEGYCFAYTGDGWTPESARAQCASAPDAAFTAAACPTADQIATCTFERDSAPGREIVYSYYAPYDPTLAALACPGTFARIE